MRTWATLFPDLAPDPVAAHVPDYDRAAAESARVRRAAETTAIELARITRSDDLAELRGATASRLIGLLADVDRSIGEVAPVFSDLERLFDAHATRLRALERRTSEALARATTHWEAHDRARRERAEQADVLAGIDAQLRSLAADPVIGDRIADRIDDLERRRGHQVSIVRRCEQRVETTRDDLDRSRAEHRWLASAEDELVADTVAGLRRVDLGALRDPSSLQALAGALLDGFRVVDGLIGQLVVAIVDGVVDAAEWTLVSALQVLATEIRRILAVLAHLGATAAAAVSDRFPPEPTSGDLGGTYTIVDRGEFTVHGSVGTERGLATIVTTLGHTADEQRIERDEFEIITLDNGKYVVVLAGVTDLSHPHYGLDPHSRTVRDLDRYAAPSSRTTSVADNLYAVMVWQAMRRAGVPVGADVMIVGHSYGADTALDLAADPGFNGPGGYRVTHVVAAAYDSAPQLPEVQEHTEVLVLQNRSDAAIRGERIAHHPSRALDSFRRALDGFAGRDVHGGFAHLGSAVDEVRRATAAVDELSTGVTMPTSYQTQVVFDGADAGFGHHPDNYTEHLTTTTEPTIAAFADSVDEHGYGVGGESVAVDVSVPVGRR